MKTLLVVAMLAVLGCTPVKHPTEKASERVDDLEKRVKELEKFCTKIKDESRPNCQEAMGDRICELEKFCGAVRLEMKKGESEQIKKPPQDIAPIPTIIYVPIIVDPDKDKEQRYYEEFRKRRQP